MEQVRGLQGDDLRLELIEIGLHPKHGVPTHFFRMMESVSGAQVGSINLRLSSSDHVRLYAGHIGYGVEPEYRGRRYAARSVRLLMPIARELGMRELWITCDPENLASRRSCELAGATLVEIVDVPEDCAIRRSGHPRKCRYVLPV